MAQVSRSLCCCVFVRRFSGVCAAAGAALGQKGLKGAVWEAHPSREGSRKELCGEQ